MRKIRTRAFSILLTCAMLLSLLPVTALAADSPVEYQDENEKLQFCTDYTTVQTDTTEWKSTTEGQAAWYVVSGNVTIENTRITVTGDVHLILADDCTLTAQKGIYVGSGNSLTIYGQSGNTGKLVANAQYATNCAGIGGNDEEDAPHGNITINGGNIVATGGSYAAGIGSGCNSASYSSTNTTPNQTITINGGKVTATGGTHAAGIGGGYANKIPGGGIVITGGTVNATGGTKAAGIGSGYNDWQESNGRSITISGGTVIANGGSDAAGIGGGQGCKETSITRITIEGDANVTANGGTRGAGIGSGYATAMTTSISIGGDAVVKAKGGGAEDYGGAGIGSGGGADSKIGSITISGGDVTATGGTATDSDMYSGAGIGSGGNSRTVDIDSWPPVITPGTGAITIDGGTITATGGTDAAGIGDGKNGVGGDFSTGENGQAIIYADSISDNDDTTGWNGIVFVDDKGTVYGDVTLADNLTLESSQTLNIPEGSSLSVPEDAKLDAGSQGLTNNGTLTILGTVTGDIEGNGAIVRDAKEEDSVASYGTLYYNSLESAITAANSADGGGTVTLLKNATLSDILDKDVILSVDSGKTLTVNDTDYLQSGTLEVKVGGGLTLGTEKLVGSTDSTINLTSGSVTMNDGTVTLTENSLAEIPSGKTFYLMLGTGGSALDAVIAENATLTVNGTLKAVSGSGESGSQVTVNGTLDVKGTLTIAQQADVTVENGGTLNLPAMTKEAMGSDTPGEGMKGDIIVKAGGKLTYAVNDVLGGDNPLMTLTKGTATLNLGNANAAEPSVSLTLNGEASVDGNTKALLLATDNSGTIIPIAISVTGTSEATVSENGVLNLVNGSSLTVADGANFTVDGILEVHSAAKFDDKATVSGKVYVFEANNGINPISGAKIILTSAGAVYAEKTELTGTAITPARMTASGKTYTSTSASASEPTTFSKQWIFSCKITLDANGGTLAGGISELWTNADGKLSTMPGNPTRSGYTFNGWYDAATGGNKVGTNTAFTADDTIYAQWIYNGGSSSGGGGGSGSGSGSSTPTYQVSVDKAEGGKITVSPTRAEKGETVTITVKPDEGYELGKLTVTDKDGDKITLTQKDDNKYTFKMPAGKVTVKATFTEIEVEPEQPELPFSDVAEQDWFYDAVVYVYENELMNGTSATTFSPSVTTSRAMMLTMLARYDGVDTSTGSTWYEAGAAWAVAEGVSDGTNLEADLTREQLVTMLWRYAGSPMVEKDLPDYPDRDEVSDWAVRAMVWAVDNGIITGNGAGELNPQGSASRAEVATILMRFIQL